MPQTKTAEKLQLELATALTETKMCTVHVVGSRGKDVRVLFTVIDNKDKQQWFRFLSELLTELQSHEEFYHFVGNKYFIEKGKMVAPWVLILDTVEGGEESIAVVISDVRRIIRNIVDEMKVDPNQPFSVSIPPPWASTAQRIQNKVKNVK